MPHPSVLLVCGSRELLYHPGAQRYVRHMIGHALRELAWLGHPDTVVLHGGAKGPDRWAGELAQERGLRAVTYLPSGWRLDSWARPRRWSPVAVHPLERNRAMVRALTNAERRVFEGGPPWMTRVLGFVAPWPTETHGTEATLRYARREGHEAREEEVPAVVGWLTWEERQAAGYASPLALVPAREGVR